MCDTWSILLSTKVTERDGQKNEKRQFWEVTSIKNYKKQIITVRKYDPQQLFDAIFKTAVDGLVVIDNRGVIQMANPATAKLFGYDLCDIIGVNVSKLMPNPHKRDHDSYIQNYEKTGKGKIIGIGREVQGLKKDGSLFPFKLSVSEVPLLDGNRFYAGVVHDISEQKAAEESIRRINEQLETQIEERTEKLAEVVNKLLETNKDLKKEIQERTTVERELRDSRKKVQEALEKERELSELKSRFVSMASHEFRTPLSTILSSASLIARYTQTEQQPKRDKHIERIKSSVKNLTGILNDFLSLSKLEEGKFEQKGEVFDLPLYIQEIIEEVKVSAKKGQELVYIHEAGDYQTFLDKQFLKNVLINLFSNAIKYSPENSEIRLISNTTKAINIAISDQGMGIPKADQEHLFTRFFRANNAINIQGTGLGLNIVKRYIDLMEGTIAFESEEGKGTTFYITLPNQLK